MLDFCYYCQVVTIFTLYIYPNNAKLFQLTFALTYVNNDIAHNLTDLSLLLHAVTDRYSWPWWLGKIL